MKLWPILPLVLCAVLPAAMSTADTRNSPPLDPCGMADPSIPDFTLTDMLPLSPTYGEPISLSDSDGKVRMIYWMYAS